MNNMFFFQFFWWHNVKKNEKVNTLHVHIFINNINKNKITMEHKNTFTISDETIKGFYALIPFTSSEITDYKDDSIAKKTSELEKK